MKLTKKNKKNIFAQGVMEYILLVGIIVVALIAMTQAMKRGTQSIIKVAADQLAAQQNADQSFSKTSGYLVSQNATSTDIRQKQIVDRVGIINYVQDEASYANINALTNMGFIEDQQ